MATRMEEILMTGNQLEYCKALDNYVLNRSERLPLPIGMVFSPKYFQHFKGFVRDPQTAWFGDRPVQDLKDFVGPGLVWSDIWKLFLVLVRSGPRLKNWTRTEPLGPGPTDFSPLIPGFSMTHTV